MSFRSSLPEPIRAAARRSYVALAGLTAADRSLPDFILVGGQRCGTTSLFRAFEQHPLIVRPRLNKGINYFDLNYHRGEAWYRAHFPRRNRTRRVHGVDSVTFEASGYYMFHPLAPARIANDLPDIKIVVMLRDPVERAFSAWKHESARGYDDVSFDEAVASESFRTEGEWERMVSDPNYQSFAYRHYSYAARSDYVPQLQQFYDRIPAARIHVLYSESFFADPKHEFTRLVDFLGVPSPQAVTFEKHNARPSGPMPIYARNVLRERFQGQAEELEKLTGQRPPWADRKDARAET